MSAETDWQLDDKLDHVQRAKSRADSALIAARLNMPVSERHRDLMAQLWAQARANVAEFWARAEAEIRAKQVPHG